MTPTERCDRIAARMRERKRGKMRVLSDQQIAQLAKYCDHTVQAVQAYLDGRPLSPRVMDDIEFAMQTRPEFAHAIRRGSLRRSA